MYNMHMTGLAVFYFAIFDFEFSKSTFLSQPQHYELGFGHNFFNFKVFWQWIGYAMIYCALMNIFCIWVPSNSDSAEGKLYGLWASGHLVLACSVLLCNLKMLQMFNLWTGWGEAIVVLSMASFYLNLWFETSRPTFEAVYDIWEEYTTNGSAWLGLLFILSCILTVETMLKVIRSVVRHIIWNTPLMVEKEVALSKFESVGKP